MNYRILPLIKDIDGNLIVPGATETDFQMDGFYTCKGKKIRRGPSGWGYENYACVQHIAGGVYCVFADDFTEIDKANAGKDIKDYGAWPWKVIEYEYDAEGNVTKETVTDTPTVKREIGGSGMCEMIEKEPTSVAAVMI